MNSAYSFISAPKLYAGFNVNVTFLNRWRIFSGFQLAENKEGLMFDYHHDGDKIFEKEYSTSVLFRFPVGIFYEASPRWKIGFSPVILYSTFFETQSTGTYRISPQTKIARYSYAWYEVDNYDTWYFATDFILERRIGRRTSAELSFSIDYKHSVPIEGENTLEFSDGQESHFHGMLNPYLCYLSIGMTYALSKKYASRFGD
jgi:hypothetical protein